MACASSGCRPGSAVCRPRATSCRPAKPQPSNQGMTDTNDSQSTRAQRPPLAFSLSGRLVLHRQPQKDREGEAVPKNLAGRTNCRVVRRGRTHLCGRGDLSASGIRTGAGSRRPRAQRLPRLPVPRFRVRCHRPMRGHALRPGTQVRQTEGVRNPRNSGSGLCVAGQRRPAAPMDPAGHAADRNRLDRLGILERPVPGASSGNDRELRGPRTSALRARLQQREPDRIGLNRRRLPQELL